MVKFIYKELITKIPILEIHSKHFIFGCYYVEDKASRSYLCLPDRTQTTQEVATLGVHVTVDSEQLLPIQVREILAYCCLAAPETCRSASE